MGSFLLIPSRNLRATLSAASRRWRLGVQSQSMSILSPSWRVDPVGRWMAPEERVAMGLENG